MPANPSSQFTWDRPQPNGESDLRPPPIVPDHELIRRIGAGAYGEVWLARNVIGAYRAVKVVRRASFRDARSYEREFRGIQQFEPISRTNDGLLDLLQAGRNDDAGYYYYVMELADPAKPGAAFGPGTGGLARSAVIEYETYAPKTLGSVLRQRGRLEPAECVQLGLSLTLALGHLHRHGLIHRDIKPANIIFVQGVPKLADIGLVTSYDDTCSFVGTEGFIAPEGPISPRADLFSLGKVLYEISTGKDRKEFPEPPTGLGESSNGREMAELNSVVLKACANDARDRYQTAEEFHADLALLNSGRSVQWKRVLERRLAFARKAGAIVGMTAVLLSGAYSYQRHQQVIVERMLTREQLQRAEGLFSAGDSSLALAVLGQALRRNPDDRLVAERIMAALKQRQFPQLIARPVDFVSEPIRRHLRPPAGIAADSEHLALALHNGTVRIMKTRTCEDAIPPIELGAAVTCIQFSPDNSIFAAAADDGTVRVVNPRTGSRLFGDLQHDGPVHAMAFDPSGKWLLTAAGDSTARVYDLNTGELRRLLRHDGAVYTVSCSPNGQWLATGCEDGRLRIWHMSSGELKHELTGTGAVYLTRFSPDGNRLAAVMVYGNAEDSRLDWAVQVWSVESWEPLASPWLHDRVYSMVFSPDSGRLLTTDLANVANLWDLSTGTRRFQLGHSSIVQWAVFSPDGRIILTASADGSARLWDAETGKPKAEPMRHDGRVWYADFGGNGSWILTLGKQVKIWAVLPSRSMQTRLAHPRWVTSAELDGTGTQVLTTTGGSILTASAINQISLDETQMIATWNLATGEPTQSVRLTNWNEAVTARLTQSGPVALAAERMDEDKFSGLARIYDLANGATSGGEIRHDDEITCADFSQDGRWLATASEDGIIKLWKARTGEQVAEFSHAGRVFRLRFGEDGNRLVSVSGAGTIMMWNVLSGTRLAGPISHAGVWFAQLSGDHRRLVSASRDFTARVWSTNGTEIARLRHTAPVEFAEFSPDSSLLVTAAGSAAQVWSVRTGKRLTYPLLHSDLVVRVQFSRDGLRLITASRDGNAQVWDAASGLKLGDPLPHDDWVLSASFSPDHRWAVTASVDGTAGIWEVPVAPSRIPTWLAELAEVVGGQRLAADGTQELVSWDDQVELKARLSKLPAGDPMEPLYQDWFWFSAGSRDNEAVE